MRISDDLVLEIDRRHIDDGRPRCYRGCPIAIALIERFPGREVVVSAMFAYVGPDRYAMDAAGMDFVQAFDGEYGVKPTTVRLTPR